ncbi:MAG: disulfide bond formation protein B [Acidimicrobiia bacterium]
MTSATSIVGNHPTGGGDPRDIDASQVADVEGTVVTAGLLALALVAVARLVAPSWFAALRRELTGLGPALAGGVAVLATAGSLWFSEGAHFPPCELCWYQRIAMYPLAVVLPLAAWRRDPGIRPYALTVAGLGLAVNAWHVFIETFPDRDPGGCDPNNPCTIRWVEGLGFWTIPRMAGACFAVILVVLWLDRPNAEEAP